MPSRGRLPSGTEIGEGGYHGETYGAEHADLTYKGLGALSPHIAGPTTQPLVYVTQCAPLTGVVTNFIVLNFTLAGPSTQPLDMLRVVRF